jgi:hypothetical protein
VIDLPDFAMPSGFSATFMDAGFTQRGVQSLGRIDRKGSRYKVSFAFPPFLPERARVIVGRLIRAKQEGIRLELPLLHDQGSPGLTVLADDVSTGKAITIEGGTPGYFCKEGYFLSIENSDGQHFLHTVSAPVRFDESGEAEVLLGEMIRYQFEAGDRVHLAKPMVQGYVEGEEWQWAYMIERMIPIEFTLEEAR